MHDRRSLYLAVMLVALPSSVSGLSACAMGAMDEATGDAGTVLQLDAGQSTTDARADAAEGGLSPDATAVALDATSVDAPMDSNDPDSADPAEDAGPDGASLDAALADAGSDSGGGSLLTCSASPDCSGAVTLASVDGDEGSQQDVQSGTTSAWYVVDVVDTDAWSTTDQELVHITLASPAGADFDLYTYEYSGTSSHECSTIAMSSTNGPGQLDSVDLSWNDGLGTDDSKNITIEVRARAADVCMAGQSWTLTVSGNSQ